MGGPDPCRCIQSQAGSQAGIGPMSVPHEGALVCKAGTEGGELCPKEPAEPQRRPAATQLCPRRKERTLLLAVRTGWLASGLSAFCQVRDHSIPPEGSEAVGRGVMAVGSFPPPGNWGGSCESGAAERLHEPSLCRQGSQFSSEF